MRSLGKDTRVLKCTGRTFEATREIHVGDETHGKGSLVDIYMKWYKTIFYMIHGPNQGNEYT